MDGVTRHTFFKRLQAWIKWIPTFLQFYVTFGHMAPCLKE